MRSINDPGQTGKPASGREQVGGGAETLPATFQLRGLHQVLLHQLRGSYKVAT